MIAWSAMYLPRLFVCHSDLQAGSEASEIAEIWVALGRMPAVSCDGNILGVLLIFYFDVDFLKIFLHMVY